MFQNSRITLKTTFTTLAALYLGYTFFDLLLKELTPASMAVPAVLISAVGFTLVMRWLREKEIAPASNTFKVRKPQRIRTGIFAPDQQHVFRSRKSNMACRRNACAVPANHNA